MKFYYYRLLGMDIALSIHGPVLIEINAFPDLVAMEQATGPLLKDERIRTEFRKYDLFINNLQYNLK
jgi:glutathione synthase/RimK-type ligase-like ATP-grasp enzyme